MVLFGFTTGLRSGEIRDLAKSDLNEKDKTITVNKSMKREKVFINENEWEWRVGVGDTKTDTSQRIVSFPAFVL